MCTAVTYKTKDHYFGRTLDYELSYQEAVVITPRRFPFDFRMAGDLKEHYALIGMAHTSENYPLYYEATNEKGLSMAGLNFPGNADYKQPAAGKDNIAPFEFIPWVLGQCANLLEARKLLERIRLVNINFSEKLPLSPLHWMISDREASITVEAVEDGLHIYENPVGILTNNPPFPFHMYNLGNYLSVSREEPKNQLAQGLDLKPYSRGMGALGLPGDLSSASRFVRAVFTKMNSLSGETEKESVSQFFHILGSVTQQRGCVHLGKEDYEITIYTSCCNTDKGIYYYTTYDNSRISAVDMHREDLNGTEWFSYPLLKEQDVKFQN